MKGRKMERREMEKGRALTGGQAACFAPRPWYFMSKVRHDS